MSVIRLDLNKCIGCKLCVEVCPMDVFYFDTQAKKSVIAYPENCQNCGQCYVNCPGRSIGMSNESYGYPMTAYRSLTEAPVNHYELTRPGVLHQVMKGNLPEKR